MNVIYVGTVPPQHIINIIKEKGSYMDFATLAFQNALVAGLDYWYPNIKIVSGIRVDCFPKVNKVYFLPENYSHKGAENKEDRFVGIVNLPVLKRLFLFIDKRRTIKRMLKRGEDNVIIMYSMPSSQLLAVATLKKYISRSCLVVPDLPEYMSEKQGLLRRIAKRIDRQLIDWSVKRIDTFALLSAHMADRLPIDGKKRCVLEGIYNRMDGDIAPTDDYKPYHSIMYSGDLSLLYGIKDLLDAFELIEDENYRLIICGDGGGKKNVIELAEKDSRVIFLGVIDRPKVLSLQRGVSALVNPRHKSEEFTRYSFPSKTMEYLASGTPVIMHHLDCIPSDYDEYINYIDKETPESLRDKIIEVCQTKQQETKDRGARARRFILEQKNSIIQAKKIVDLIS